MTNWNELKHGDKVTNKTDQSVLEVFIWHGEKYLAGNKDMWLVSEFDPRDWEIINE